MGFTIINPHRFAAAGGGGSPPPIKSVSKANGYAANTIAVPVGATVATDGIFIAVASGNLTVTAPNFTEVGSIYDADYLVKLTVLKWDGGGTRPNSSNVTVTLSSAGNVAALALVCEGNTTGTALTLTNSYGIAGVDMNAPQPTCAANSTVFYFVTGNPSHEATVIAPTTVPTFEDTLPATEVWYRETQGATNCRLDFFTDEFAAGGTAAQAAVEYAAYNRSSWVAFGVSGGA